MEERTTGNTIMAALTTLTPPQFSSFTTTISALFHLHHRRLSSILSSHTLFTLSIHHLHTLSLHQKSLLIARHLLSFLSHLSHFLHPAKTTSATTMVNHRDLDSVLLLLLLCELHQHDPESLKKLSPEKWRDSLSGYVSTTMLTLSGIGFSTSETLMKYIEVVTRCRKFVEVMGCGDGKEGREVAASVAAVVALPSVEVEEGGKECVVCKEEMRKGRDVCELPCEHRFHWMCILPWLIKRNTCPCCRHRLPTDDLYGEIGRQWAVLVKISDGYY